MGLDTVELVLAIEEEFKIDIPDVDAEKLTTMGDVHRYVCRVQKISAPRVSRVRQAFYKVRNALTKIYGLDRKTLKPRTKLSDVLPIAMARDGWHGLTHLEDLAYPDFEWKRWPSWGTANYVYGLTIGELAIILLALNRSAFPIEPGTTEEIWLRLVDVVVRQLNVNVIELRPNARFTRDLGAE